MRYSPLLSRALCRPQLSQRSAGSESILGKPEAIGSADHFRLARHPGLVANGPARITFCGRFAAGSRGNDRIAKSSFGADASREDNRG
jgi:hypothetical protein